MKKQKRISFENFTNTINRNSSTGEIWNKIRHLSNSDINKKIIAIEHNNQIVTDPSLIAKTFADKWSDYSADHNFSRQFINSKNIPHIAYSNNIINDNASYIEKDITRMELECCLSKVKGSTPGYDRVSYKMIKNISYQSKERLLKL